MSFAFFIRLR